MKAFAPLIKKAVFVLALVLLALFALPAICIFVEIIIPAGWFDYGKGTLIIPGRNGGAILMLLAFFLTAGLILFFTNLILRRFKNAYPTWKVFLFNALFVLLAFTCFEVKLRYSGFAPGMNYSGYERVDSIVDLHINTCDKNGVNKYNVNYPWSDRHINADGFISRYDYSSPIIDSIRKLGKKIIMVVGDSFVEGVSSSGWDHSFMELLRKKPAGYEVLNFGVGGMDPVNYKLEVEEYLNQIKPDLLLVVCCDNDIMQQNRLVTPGIPLLYSASTNGLYSQAAIAEGVSNAQVFKTFDEACRYYFYVNYKGSHGNLFYKYISYSTLVTKVATAIHRRAPCWENQPPELQGVTNKYLRSINSFSTGNKINCLFILIPGIEHQKPDDNWLRETAKPEFKGLESKTYFFTNAKFEDYISYQNKHLNDVGNEKLAVVVDSLIKTQTGIK